MQNNPIRRDQAQLLSQIVAHLWRPSNLILDLGCGTGRVAAMILRHQPKARLIGLDSSPVMIEFASRRLARYKGFKAQQVDFRQAYQLDKAAREYTFIYSVLTMHELSQPQQRKVFTWTYKQLRKGGLFLLNDRVAIDIKAGHNIYQAVWEHAQQRRPPNRRISFSQHISSPQFRDGQPFRLEKLLATLRQIGFEPECVQLFLDRALIVCRK